MMKRMNMKGKLFAALLVCVLAGMLGATAPAWASRPNWVSSKATVGIVRNEKQKDPNAGDYKQIRVTVTYTNNSRDRIVTECFNKTMDLACGFYINEVVTEKYRALDEDDDYYYMAERKVKKDVQLASYKRDGVKYSKVDKLKDVYPGQTWTLTYYLGINLSNKWKAESRKKFNTGNIFLKDIKWSHGFQVKSKGMTDGKVYVD